MTDYKKLVEALRCELHFTSCPETNCKYICHDTFCDTYRLMIDAADAIEALQAEVKRLELDNEDYEHENRRLHGEIEALQAEQKKTVTQIFGEEQMAWEGRCKDLMKHISDLQAEVERLKDSNEELQQIADHYKQSAKDYWKEACEYKAQLPKRGEWVEDTTTYAGPGLSNYKCSLCGKIGGTWRRGLKPSKLPNWCGNCGADMRKMEVQDDKTGV